METPRTLGRVCLAGSSNTATMSTGWESSTTLACHRIMTVRKTPSFAPLMKKVICQDRLGTNAKKTQQKTVPAGDLSWSDPARYSQGGETPLLPGFTDLQDSTTMILAPDYQTVMAGIDCITGEPGGSYCEINGTAGPDDHLMEAGVASVKLLANYSKATKVPFFLGWFVSSCLLLLVVHHSCRIASLLPLCCAVLTD